MAASQCWRWRRRSTLNFTAVFNMPFESEIFFSKFRLYCETARKQLKNVYLLHGKEREERALFLISLYGWMAWAWPVQIFLMLVLHEGTSVFSRKLRVRCSFPRTRSRKLTVPLLSSHSSNGEQARDKPLHGTPIFNRALTCGLPHCRSIVSRILLARETRQAGYKLGILISPHN